MRNFLLVSIAILATVIDTHRSVADLPDVSDRRPVRATHFPDALHAVVWRNWQLVESERLSKVLGTTPEKVTEMAASMGLPRDPQVPREMKDRGYITIIRRNWHLLPYEQLVELLGVTPEALAFTLREDDFLYIKLGSMKPTCDAVKYAEPSPDARRRAAEIKQLVERQFGERLRQPQEPRFRFVSELAQLPETTSPAPPADRAEGGSEGPRFIYSYFALFGDPLSNAELDPYPDGLLARLRERGVNGVWLHVVLRQLAPGGPHFPEWGEGHELRAANLRKLVERAKRFGIDVYLYMNEPRAMPQSFFANRPEMLGTREGDFAAVCTSDPRVRQWLSDSLAYVFTQAPGLGGIFTITASENFTHCASHGNHAACPRCKPRTDTEIIAEVNAAMEAGVHRAAPEAKVLAWDWGWKNHGDGTDIIRKLPASTWLMSVSEWSLPIERGGVSSEVGEYSISAVGPGPRAQRHWQFAKQRGLKTVAKVQFNNTWELSSVPYLPVMDLVAEHGSHLAEAGTDGLMLSWSLGGYPSPNLELAQQFSRHPAPDVPTALQVVAERHFGLQAAPQVRQAWSKFSRAFREFPYCGAVLYQGPQQMGPANLLYAAPTGYASSMVGFPYDDLNGWRGPYPSEVLGRQFEKMAEGWAEGLADLQAAQSLVPAKLRTEAVADLRVAEAAQIHFASAAHQTKFILVRDKFLAANDPAERRRFCEEMISLLDQEIELARRLYDLAVLDSRLGYEASNHYFYVPQDLMEKVLNCVQLRDHFAATP